MRTHTHIHPHTLTHSHTGRWDSGGGSWRGKWEGERKEGKTRKKRGKSARRQDWKWNREPIYALLTIANNRDDDVGHYTMGMCASVCVCDCMCDCKWSCACARERVSDWNGEKEMEPVRLSLYPFSGPELEIKSFLFPVAETIKSSWGQKCIWQQLSTLR